MVEKMLNWVASLPLWQATLFLFIVVFFRAQMTFGLGKLTHMGILKTKWGKKAEKSEENRAGMLALQKYGWPVIPLSFLTVGFQTVVQLAAGMLDWKWSKYTLVALPGYLAWGFVYAAGGLTLFRSIANGSIGLLILFVIIVLLLWSVGTFLVKKLKPNA
ncbi:SNARE-associated domain-containing protein [Lactococcus petauri]|uniref:VTT domain-containing protein n=1 Tax=Lactococcus petauri TaxID=1940789 RepID=UPI0013FD9F75|nr:VTT domain-containing protein [Lactococcus petauri]NHI65880.1 hypothetical protein [Lactococcus petauri]